MADGVQSRAVDAALAQAFAVLGKRWNGVILGVLGGGSATYGELRRAVGGISDAVLSDRLVELAAAGLVLRTVTDGPPVGVAYALTTSGTALTPVMTQLAVWGERDLASRRSSGTESAQRH